MSGDLFGEPEPPSVDASTPLAERMRPSRLQDVVGQDHVVAPGRLLHGIVRRGEPVSLLLWGPPGVGKTTLARILAAETGARFVEISATSAGVKQVREAAEAASLLRRRSGARTVLFVDEIHRFNKAQQDALLPWVESGDVVFIGATTENPSFEVVPPLLSRARVVRLEALSEAAVEELMSRALQAPAPRGLAGVLVENAALARIAAAVEGDARAALNTLELAAAMASSADGVSGPVTEALAVEALQRPVLRHDREEHFNQISALQKSVRNSDVDAALYWLARMIEAGEDPVYVARRLIRMASEDIGLADPQALGLTIAALDAVRAIGLPEGALALAEATIYLAAAPKSDAVERAWESARQEVSRSGSLPVPMQLRNAVTPLMRAQGYGSGYRHAHDEETGVSAMRCLPEEIAGRRFYSPGPRGYEARIAELLQAISSVRKAKDPSSEPA